MGANEDFLNIVFENIPSGLDAINRHALLRFYFQTYYGINNHFETDKRAKYPFGTKAFTPALEVPYRYTLKEHVMIYHEKQLKELGITFLEYMSMPITVIDEIIEGNEEGMARKAKKMDDLFRSPE